MLQDQALAGLRVVEFGSAVAVPYCGKLLADLGAEVVKVEPPGGEAGRRYEPALQLADGRRESALFLYLNQGKKSVTLDSSREGDRRTMTELVQWADLFIADLPRAERSPWSLDPASLTALNPRLVYLSVTPFGDSGPLADWSGTDLIAAHAGGLAWITPMQPDETDSSPLRPGGDQADFLAALLGAYAALIARHHQRQTGQGQIIDLSRQESVISILDNVIPTLSYEGGILRRGRVMPTAPCHVIECKDGYVFAQTTEEPEWARFLELTGNPGWGQDERFRDRFERAKHWNELVPLMEPWLKSRSKAEIYLSAQERRVAFNPVNSAPDLLAYEHFEARDFFVGLPDCPEIRVPGAPFKLSKTPWRQSGRAPSLGEHNDSVLGELMSSDRAEGSVGAASSAATPTSTKTSDSLPLSGMRVTDFSWHWAGPFCSKMLGHMGAEVIKIESQAKMEHSRHARPFADGLAGLNRSGLFNSRNQSRLGIRLNLKTQEGKALAKRLIAISDVVLENFAAGVMARLGLDYEALSANNPRLVMCSASAYGATGPHRGFISYGATQCAFTGLAQITGYEGGPPNMVGVHLADPVGGLYAGIAILAALEHRDRTGEGQYIDLSQAETMSALLVE
ncbi:MAG: CaiB/BaiF CoA transferase family protein, partial [Chloroflexota bacterium]